jgi:hypothetical protein
MASARTRLLVAAAALLTLALATGCSDNGAPAGPDAAVGWDAGAPSPDGAGAAPDGQSAPLDAGPWWHDGAAAVDSSAADAEEPEAGRTPSLDSGAARDGATSSRDAGGSDSAVAPEAPPPPPTTLIVLPDTQYYASTYPGVFTQQTNWILAQRAALNISAVLHVGDVVDAPFSSDQWNAASTAMRVLDNTLPYLFVSGNHDTDANRQGLMDSTFPPASMPWIAGTMTPGRIDNSYMFITLGGRTWLVLGLEFGPRDAVVAWADAILKTYPTVPAMLVTHAYLYRDGTRYNLAVAGADQNQPSYQYFFPAYYGFTANQGINDGEMLWQKLVVPNPNVRLVFSGHDTGGARLTSTRPDGSVVHQMLSDYQWLEAQDFGFGYLRILRFDFAKKTIDVVTYSPYLQKYLTDAENQFTLDLYP